MANFYNTNENSYLSPSGRTRKTMANALLQNATKNEPVYGWGQALAKVLAGGVAGYQLGKGAKEEQENMSAAPQEIARAIKNGGEQWTDPDTGQKSGPVSPDTGTLLSMSGNPAVQEMAPGFMFKQAEDANTAEQKKSLLDYRYGKSMELKNGGKTNSLMPEVPTGNLPPNLTGDPTIDKKLKENYGKGLGKQAADAPGQDAAKTRLDNIFIKMNERFSKLHDMGATPEQGPLAALSNTEGVDLPFGFKSIGGQDIARLKGTPEQGIRDLLKGDIQDIKTEYQKASGLTSKQLDSNQEAKQFLQGLPNLLNQYGSNKQRISDMSERFGNSIAKAKIESESAPKVPSGGNVPAAAIDALKNDPDREGAIKDFEEHFKVPAQQYLGMPESNASPVITPQPTAAAQQSLSSPRMTEGTDPEIISNLVQQMKARGQTDQQIQAYLKSKGLA